MMVNNLPCKVEIIGSFSIKILNETISIFSNLNHVLELRENGISLNNLDARGYRFKNEGSVLEV